jgi:hypothetical protein
MLHIIYRTCGGEDTRSEHKRRRPHAELDPPPIVRTDWFDKRAYFTSVARELDDEVRMTIVYDGDRAALRDYIVEQWVTRYPRRFTLHPIAVHDNRRSLLECYRIADADASSDAFYFLEDDYLHREGWLRVLREGLEQLPPDAVITLYDHPDRYQRSDDVTSGRESIRLTPSTHWRTAESTTCTCAMRQALWQQVRGVFITGGIRDRQVYRALIERHVRLWQPVPGYSTHDHIKKLSPLVDWRAVRERLDE